MKKFQRNIPEIELFIVIEVLWKYARALYTFLIK